MKSNKNKTKVNENQNANVTQKTKETKQEPYITGLSDKPMMEYSNPGVPLTLKVLPGEDNSDHPTLIDPASYDKSFIVEDQDIYTIRLGMHSCPFGAGAMDVNTMASCLIPTEAAEAIRIFGLFFIPELYPATFLDTKILCTQEHSQKFRIVYEYGSAMLESNNNSKSLILPSDAISVNEDEVIILQNGVRDLIPKHCTFTYDFLTFRVKIEFCEG